MSLGEMRRDAAQPLPVSADEKALLEAMVALRPRLKRFALGMCGSVDDAEDLVLGAFERAIRDFR